MRIIIEIDKDGIPLQVQTEAESDESGVINGGPPEGLATGSLEGEQADISASEAKTAGGPPDWLIQSIESAMAAETADQQTNSEDDGGSAPG